MLATYMQCVCNNNLEIRIATPLVARNFLIYAKNAMFCKGLAVK